MERKIGEIFEYNGEWYQCVECDSCGKCSLHTTECGSGTKSDLAVEVFGECSKIRRSDSKHAIFKKLEKVGEPFSNEHFGLVQKYELKMYGYSTKDKRVCFADGYDVFIKPKQTKEDMEEKKSAMDFVVTPPRLTGDKPEHQLNLKSFDLQKAKAGKPVCTRDGRKTRIICFDRVNAKPILALIASTDGNGEDVFDYFVSGKRIANALESDLDLMMLPEKRSGWAKVRKDINLYDTKEEADRKMIGNDEYVTAKVYWEE